MGLYGSSISLRQRHHLLLPPCCRKYLLQHACFNCCSRLARTVIARKLNGPIRYAASTPPLLGPTIILNKWSVVWSWSNPGFTYVSEQSCLKYSVVLTWMWSLRFCRPPFRYHLFTRSSSFGRESASSKHGHVIRFRDALRFRKSAIRGGAHLLRLGSLCLHECLLIHRFFKPSLRSFRLWLPS